MKQSLSFFIFTICMISASSWAQETKPSVTLPLEVYREYLSLKERPSLTIVDNVQISGKLNSNALTIKLTGQSSGTLPDVRFLQDSARIAFKDCKGSAILHRQKDGYAILPRSATFSISCDMSFASQDSLTLDFDASVLNVQVNVADATFTKIDSGNGTQKISMTRKKQFDVNRSTQAKLSVLPRYRISVDSDQIRFFYLLTVENPNTEAKPIAIAWKNQEIVNQVQTDVANDWNDKSLNFKAKPGTTTVSIFGQLPHPEFKPLFDLEEQYLLLEFHPLVAIKFKQEAPRVGMEQTGLSSTYPASISYLIGKGKSLSWESKIREVFASESFATNNAGYTVYLPSRGESIIDASWDFKNQGKPSLSFQTPKKVYFAASDGQPQVLAKTDNQELFLPIRSGDTSLRIQYEPLRDLPRWIGYWKENLVKPASTLPTTSVALLLPKNIHLIAASISDGVSSFPWLDPWIFCIACLLALLWVGFLKHVSSTDHRFSGLSAAGLLLLGLSNSAWLLAALIIMLFGLAAKYREIIFQWFASIKPKTRHWTLAILSIVTICCIGTIFLNTLPRPGVHYSVASKMPAYETQARSSDEFLADAAPAETSHGVGMGTTGQGGGKASEESYLGLPVERTIPSDGVETYLLNAYATPADVALTIRAWVVHSSIASIFSLILLCLWVFPIQRHWREIKKSLMNA